MDLQVRERVLQTVGPKGASVHEVLAGDHRWVLIQRKVGKVRNAKVRRALERSLKMGGVGDAVLYSLELRANREQLRHVADFVGVAPVSGPDEWPGVVVIGDPSLKLAREAKHRSRRLSSKVRDSEQPVWNSGVGATVARVPTKVRGPVPMTVISTETGITARREWRDDAWVKVETFPTALGIHWATHLTARQAVHLLDERSSGVSQLVVSVGESGPLSVPPDALLIANDEFDTHSNYVRATTAVGIFQWRRIGRSIAQFGWLRDVEDADLSELLGSEALSPWFGLTATDLVIRRWRDDGPIVAQELGTSSALYRRI